MYASSRPILLSIRRMLNPILKLFFNPNPLIEAMHIQSRLNDSYNRSEALYYELIHNLVLEITRSSIEVKNLQMRLESISSRLDFDERRARALEGVVQYRPGAVPPLQPPTGQNDRDVEGNERRLRRRRRRGRRRGPSFGREHGAGEGGPSSAESSGDSAQDPHDAPDAAAEFGAPAPPSSPADPAHEP
jgi:hypothetical protein